MQGKKGLQELQKSLRCHYCMWAGMKTSCVSVKKKKKIHSHHICYCLISREPGWPGFFLGPCSLLVLELSFMSRVNVKCITFFCLTILGVCSVSLLSSLPPITMSACCSSSPAYNWIWVWNRRAVGSEIKEGRLSLHLRWGMQNSPVSLSSQTACSHSFPFWSKDPSSNTETGNSVSY